MRDCGAQAMAAAGENDITSISQSIVARDIHWRRLIAVKLTFSN
jgi:hypothetical protein